MKINLRTYILSAVFMVLITASAFYFNFNSLQDANKGLTGESIAVNLENADLSYERITIPVKAHVVKSSEVYSSERGEENIRALFFEINRIWGPAGIYFELEEIEETNLSEEAIPKALNSNAREIYFHDNFNNEKINIFFTGSLGRINGIALVSINTALVSDFTTVNDFRTTSHELGHILGLKHVLPADRLMAQGKNGELLKGEEILMAREYSSKLFQSG